MFMTQVESISDAVTSAWPLGINALHMSVALNHIYKICLSKRGYKPRVDNRLDFDLSANRCRHREIMNTNYNKCPVWNNIVLENPSEYISERWDKAVWQSDPGVITTNLINHAVENPPKHWQYRVPSLNQGTQPNRCTKRNLCERSYLFLIPDWLCWKNGNIFLIVWLSFGPLYVSSRRLMSTDAHLTQFLYPLSD